MSASSLPIKLVDLGIKIKDWMKTADYESDAVAVDHFLCQYNYKCVCDKEELISSMLSTFNTRRCCEMIIPEEAIRGINEFCLLLEKLKKELEEIQKFGFVRFTYNNKEYLVMRDVFSWVITDKYVVVLLQDKGRSFEDNLVALSFSGNIIWSSNKCIDCPNRMGAVFVGLSDCDERTIIATAYVGINYYIDIKSGKVKVKKITK